MIQVKDGKVLSTTLPKNGFLSDGRAVSNYKHLPGKVLEKEGWAEPEESKPKITKDQELGKVKYEVRDGKAIKTYEVIEKPKVVEPEPVIDPIEDIKKRIDALEGKVLKEIKG